MHWLSQEQGTIPETGEGKEVTPYHYLNCTFSHFEHGSPQGKCGSHISITLPASTKQQSHGTARKLKSFHFILTSKAPSAKDHPSAEGRGWGSSLITFCPPSCPSSTELLLRAGEAWLVKAECCTSTPGVAEGEEPCESRNKGFYLSLARRITELP